MCSRAPATHDAPMNKYVLYHRHAATDCAATFAAWNGFHSELRRTTTSSTCAFNGHEIWWTVAAANERAAAAHLPNFVAARTIVVRVADVEIP